MTPSPSLASASGSACRCNPDSTSHALAPQLHRRPGHNRRPLDRRLQSLEQRNRGPRCDHQRRSTRCRDPCALAPAEPLTRYERSRILNRTRELLEARREEFANLITQEAGLCLRETRYEVGRACDVFTFAAMEALRDEAKYSPATSHPAARLVRSSPCASRLRS